MTRDDIIRIAREAGMSVTAPSWGYTENYHFASYEDKLERFAALVAAAEREACARVCESDVGMLGKGDLGEFWADKCAAAIRARGNV